MTTNVPDALKDFRSLWWLFVLFGVLTLAAGIILIVWPRSEERRVGKECRL